MSLVQNHQISVLVVDSNAESRSLLHEALIADGYGCRAVGDLPSALKSAKERTPELLICEMNLGEHTGLDLLRKLKQITDCTVIFISDSRDADMVTHARKAGGSYFLAKPIDTNVLVEIVDKALWMPHLVQRHVDSKAHQVKAPTFSMGNTSGAMKASF